MALNAGVPDTSQRAPARLATALALPVQRRLLHTPCAQQSCSGALHSVQVCGVVTKPGGASDNGKDSNVQVQHAARKLGLHPHQILTPASPKEVSKAPWSDTTPV